MRHLFSTRTLVVAACAGLTLTMAGAPATQAMPNFARQYGANCSMCHSVVPRLNKVGWQFRRAGFRLPEEIGTEREFEKNRTGTGMELGNYFAARLQSNVSWLSRNHATATGGYSADSTFKYSTTQLEFVEFTLYPLTGGFLKHWASESELSGATNNIEVENAWVRYDHGTAKGFGELRLGLFHPFEGYGASDRPLGLQRPLIQRSTALNNIGDKNGFTPWGFDETGAEAGITLANTSLTATLFNGLLPDAGDPAQGGELVKPAGSLSQDSKDFQLFANQFLGPMDAALSAYYYNGRLDITTNALLGAPYQEKFQRYVVYGTLPIRTLLLLGGWGGGTDQADDIAATDDKAKSMGWFAEANAQVSSMVAIGARYDLFDPTDLDPVGVEDRDKTKAITAFVNVPLQNGLQLITEFRNLRQQKGVDGTGAALPDQTTNSLNARFIYIF